jgi:glycosyltransferase involved in cell wall biosynthesis
MNPLQKISCIICAYNEERQIGHVLEVTLAHPLIDEVIVINDASTDKTREIIFEYERSFSGRLRAHHYETNKGKSAALAFAVAQAHHELILFLDADLVGLTQEALTELIAPVIKEEADMSMSIRKNSFKTYKRLGIDPVSGERLYKKELIVPHLATIAALPGFAVETFINELAIQKGLRVRAVYWPHTSHLRKKDKYGFWRGMWGDWRTAYAILKMSSGVKFLRHVQKMRRLTR